MVTAEALAAPPSLTLDGRLVNTLNSLLVTATLAAPLLSADLVALPASAMAKALPWLGQLLASQLSWLAAKCEAFRLRRTFAFVLFHGALTYACGDLVAQTAFAPAAAAAAGVGRLWWPLQTLWAAMVGLLSDTLPFYYWSTALARLDVGSPLLRRSRLLQRRPALLLPLKIVLHLATFQPACTAAYLFLQGLRVAHGSVGGALNFMQRKFATAALPAVVTFAVGGPIVYSLPSIVAQSALRNLGVLAMCIYLAIVSSEGGAVPGSP